jgi:hypothetical protein
MLTHASKADIFGSSQAHFPTLAIVAPHEHP